MRTNTYLTYRYANYPALLVKQAVSSGGSSSSDTTLSSSSSSGSTSTSTPSTSSGRRYSQAEFDNLIQQYEASKRGDIPHGTPEAVFDSRKAERQGTLNDLNEKIRRNRHRANGVRTWMVGAGGLGGYHAGRLLSKLFELDRGPQTGLDSLNNPVYGKRGWGKFLGDWGLRLGGMALGGAIPYFLTRGLEGAWGAGAAGVRGLTGGRG